MNITRKFFAGFVVAAIVALGAAFTAPAATAGGATVSAAPLKIKVAPFAGTRVQVAKKLKVIVSCSKDCDAKVKVTLITPVGTSSVKGGRSLSAGSGWITGMILTNYGVTLLKNHFRFSRLKVEVTATNVSNGTVRKQTKSFLFRR
ncbi:MAG: hypothetical protein KDB48_07875 [Solirubrobacterales bacterium]|nr:hypothetical protein [Solirubrobacterales bacterium]HMT05810.1 hypothetical protein [Solirubrobacterales bacterium]